MPLIILGLFIAVPIIEIAVFIQVGGLIGLWPTIAIVVATAFAGTFLLRQQGLATLGRAQEAMARGEMPLREVFDGACLLVAGVLLLTPGFVTDTVGLLLFLPPVRAWLRKGVVPALVKSGRVHYSATFTGDFAERPSAPPRRPYEIEGEFREVDETPPPAGDDQGDGSLPPRPGPPRP
ncbi:FxsA family protein [Caenispirillum bisanense]|uniref:FxsA family protein n=1 Tax=Caenispirillum bisanense TaxID=414052 RepID=UPI0031DE1426